jgi:hypothetical protein
VPIDEFRTRTAISDQVYLRINRRDFVTSSIRAAVERVGLVFGGRLLMMWSGLRCTSTLHLGVRHDYGGTWIYIHALL